MESKTRHSPARRAKAGADAAIHAHARRDVLYVGIHGLGQVGHGVDERDFQRQKCVGGMFDDLRALRRSYQQFGWHSGAACPLQGVWLCVISAPGERLIDAPQDFGGTLGVSPHYDAVGMQKVDHRRAFTQELGVRDHIEAALRHAIAMQHAPYPLVGVHRHCALFHDDFVAVDGAGNLRDHGLYIGEISRAGITLRRTHCNEHSLALFHGRA